MAYSLMVRMTTMPTNADTAGPIDDGYIELIIDVLSVASTFFR